MGEERGVYRVLVAKPEEKSPLGRPRRRWVDNIRMDLQEVGCGYMDWIGLAQGRHRWRTLVSAVMNLRVPWNAGIFLTSCKPVSFSRRTVHHGVSKYEESLRKSQKQLCFLAVHEMPDSLNDSLLKTLIVTQKITKLLYRVSFSLNYCIKKLCYWDSDLKIYTHIPGTMQNRTCS